MQVELAFLPGIYLIFCFDGQTITVLRCSFAVECPLSRRIVHPQESGSSSGRKRAMEFSEGERKQIHTLESMDHVLHQWKRWRITPHHALYGIMDIFGSYVQSMDTRAVPESSMSHSPPQQVGRPASDSIIVAD